MAEAVSEELDGAALAAAAPRGSELTWQALVAGALVAAVMGCAYPYMVLKLGFGPNVSIVSAFFGFILLSIIARKSYDRWRNNIVQTAGTSAAQTAFMCGVLAAFDMLRSSKVVHFTLNPTPLQVFIWLTTASLLGRAPRRAHAPPLRRRREAGLPGRHGRGRDPDRARPPARRGDPVRGGPRLRAPRGDGAGRRHARLRPRHAVPQRRPHLQPDPGGLDARRAHAGRGRRVVRARRHGRRRRLQPAQPGLRHAGRPAHQHLDAGRLHPRLDRRAVASDHPRRPAEHADPQPGALLGDVAGRGDDDGRRAGRPLPALAHADRGLPRAGRRAQRGGGVSAALGRRRRRGAGGGALRDPAGLLRPAAVDERGRDRALRSPDAGRPARAGRDQLGADRTALQPDAGPVRPARARQRAWPTSWARDDRDDRGDLGRPDAGLQGRAPDRLDAALDDHRPADGRADRRRGARRHLPGAGQDLRHRRRPRRARRAGLAADGRARRAAQRRLRQDLPLGADRRRHRRGARRRLRHLRDAAGACAAGRRRRPGSASASCCPSLRCSRSSSAAWPAPIWQARDPRPRPSAT